MNEVEKDKAELPDDKSIKVSLWSDWLISSALFVSKSFHTQMDNFLSKFFFFSNKQAMKPLLDPNVYATKKTVAQGMLDVALLTSNASQLKFLLQKGRENDFYVLMVTLISLSIVLQVRLLQVQSIAFPVINNQSIPMAIVRLGLVVQYWPNQPIILTKRPTNEWPCCWTMSRFGWFFGLPCWTSLFPLSDSSKPHFPKWIVNSKEMPPCFEMTALISSHFSCLLPSLSCLCPFLCKCDCLAIFCSNDFRSNKLNSN